MRTFVGLLGGLFLFLGVLGLAGGVVLTAGYSFEEPDYTCTGSTGSTTLNCRTVDESQTGLQTYALGTGILGGSLFVGGCALVGGAVAGSGRRQRSTEQRSIQQSQPVAAGGPPSYGGGWPGNQQPPAGNEPPRS